MRITVVGSFERTIADSTRKAKRWGALVLDPVAGGTLVPVDCTSNGHHVVVDRARSRPVLLARQRLVCDRVRHSEDLIGLLIQQQVTIAEVLPGHAPMKILRLQAQREDIRQQGRESTADLMHGAWAEIGPTCNDGGRIAALQSGAHCNVSIRTIVALPDSCMSHSLHIQK